MLSIDFLYCFVNGAVFADAGNVWNSKENTSLPGGQFSSNFLNELGMGAGFGLRQIFKVL